MFKEIINQINANPPNILVIGDLMLDKFIFGCVDRVSPEAPVPIVKLQSEKHMLGGCGNVIRNLDNLGVETTIVSVIGQDHIGDLLIEELSKKGIPISDILRLQNIRTTEKIRIVADRQQVVRVDWDMDNFEIENNEKLFEIVSNKINGIDGIIISDYLKGVCSKELIKKVIDLAKENNVPVYVDPKGTEWEKYRLASLVTPNAKEAESIVGKKLVIDNDFELAGKTICNSFNIGACLITRGSDGMSYISNNEVFHLKSEAKEIFDVSGAGDTVIASIAAALVIDSDSQKAVEFSNIAAGIVVGHIGTSAVTTQELLDI